MSEYKYAGIELTPNIFAELLILLFDGKQFKRATAIEEITKYHHDGGGILGKKEYVAVFKKACQNLSSSGLSNIGYGTWRLNYEIQEVEIIEEEVTNTVEYAVDKTIGSGDNSVYVYMVHMKMLPSTVSVWACLIYTATNLGETKSTLFAAQILSISRLARTIPPLQRLH